MGKREKSKKQFWQKRLPLFGFGSSSSRLRMATGMAAVLLLWTNRFLHTRRAIYSATKITKWYMHIDCFFRSIHMKTGWWNSKDRKISLNWKKEICFNFSRLQIPNHCVTYKEGSIFYRKRKTYQNHHQNFFYLIHIYITSIKLRLLEFNKHEGGTRKNIALKILHN